MRTSTVIARVVGPALAAMVALAACKSEEEKRAEAVAKAQTALVEAQAKVAEAQIEKGTEALAKQGEALGQQGAALGMQAAAAGMEAAAAAMNNVATGMGNAPAGTASLVDFRELKALLPEKIGGLTRRKASGEKNVALGFGASKAEASYEGDGDAHLKIELIDTGGLGGLAAGAMAFAGFEVDKESDDGYERTSTVDGRKFLEKYTTSSKRGELKVMVGKRFFVEVDGRNLPMDTLKEAVAKLDLAKLEALGAAAKK